MKHLMISVALVFGLGAFHASGFGFAQNRVPVPQPAPPVAQSTEKPTPVTEAEKPWYEVENSPLFQMRIADYGDTVRLTFPSASPEPGYFRHIIPTSLAYEQGEMFQNRWSPFSFLDNEEPFFEFRKSDLTNWASIILMTHTDQGDTKLLAVINNPQSAYEVGFGALASSALTSSSSSSSASSSAAATPSTAASEKTDNGEVDGMWLKFKCPSGAKVSNGGADGCIVKVKTKGADGKLSDWQEIEIAVGQELPVSAANVVTAKMNYWK